MIFGNLGNMGEMLKQAREMQGKLKQMQEELKREIYQASVGGVAVLISGDMEVKDVKIDQKIVDPTKVANLERVVKEAFSKALKDAKDGAARKMKGLTGGLGLPPGMM